MSICPAWDSSGNGRQGSGFQIIGTIEQRRAGLRALYAARLRMATAWDGARLPGDYRLPGALLSECHTAFTRYAERDFHDRLLSEIEMTTNASEFVAMRWLWTWGGECFGYREGDYLWTYSGKHAGCFHGDEVYASDGWYLGEIKQGNRLVVDRCKSGQLKPQFTRSIDRLACPRHDNYPALTLYVSHKDFPSPDTF